MLDVLIRSALDIVRRAERLIEAARRLLDRHDLAEGERYELDYEIERLRDAVLAVEEAVRSLARRSERWPQAARVHALQTTLH
ncbi:MULTISPECIES: hypothetical protein [Rhizobium]|uniref:hypothetical protein n=1 Tax=Rhizobium TaxID=379 RepID=UPI001B319459|nr:MULTISPECIES: hypothetical protein [Rhizobium]MBX4909896.1 hypothetical protein [Rhizobium bangladeshense]MBX5217547.1 hypothetical protein [Rhizobium sp. NLR9a]MBX5223658.1 hypothetical protein [Rhizobium sp. NLR8a]MBX5235562.1 hypothetical protein [Rhizobium sp. NLR4a]MBX5241685.1 hypothetical protein [Rhizobium sp. NLR22b]